MSDVLKQGTPAPEINLTDQEGNVVTLASLRGRPAILVFYPGDWTPVCGDQLALYNELLPVFKDYGAELFGISVDSRWCHVAFAENRNFRFRLLADFEPKGAIAKSYVAYRHQDGTTERALFVLDPNGLILWSYLSPINVNPGADGILQALDTLKPGART